MTASLARAVALCLALGPTGSLPAAVFVQPQDKSVALRVHEESTSRAAFRACDGNADDRLSIFEARQCLDHMGTLENPEGFRSLDTDKNGQLSWPEFDRRYREVCGRGGAFRIRPTHPFQVPRRATPVSQNDKAAAHVLRLGDKDRDGGLNISELEGLLVEFKLPKDIATGGFSVMDSDASGTVDQKELLLLVERVPVLANLARLDANGDRKGLLAGLDKDDDGKVTRKELDKTLRHLHPSLHRWSRKVFADADTNKDGVLEPAELGTPASKK